MKAMKRRTTGALVSEKRELLVMAALAPNNAAATRGIMVCNRSEL
jgi:hypothetical protein